VLKYSSQAYIKGEHKMSQKDCNIKQVKYKVKNKKGIKRSFKHIDQIERGHIYALVQEGIYSKEAKSFKNNNIQ